MAISPEAVARFLAWKPAPCPQFKGADPRWLYDTIHAFTGVPYHSPGPPIRTHQLEGLTFALWLRRSLLYYGMRLGKSRIALDWIRCCFEAGWSTEKALVIAHSPVGVHVWEGQVKQHSDLRVRTIYSGKNSLENLLQAIESDAETIITSWATLQSILSHKAVNRRGETKLVPDQEIIELLAPCFSSVVIDEIHLTGNHLSLRFRIAALLLKNCTCRLGLTGTPFGRDPFKLWASTYLIDEGETLSSNYYFFEHVFGKQRKLPFMRRPEMVFDKSKLDVLKERIATRSLSYELADVQKLNIISNIVDLGMEGEQRTAYEATLEEIIDAAKDQQQLHNTFVRLRQIASGYCSFTDEEGAQRTLVFPKSAKLEWLHEFLEEYDGSTQCVIFHEYTQSGKLICAALEKHKIKHRWLYGRTRDRVEPIEAFTSGKARILVANTATGGTALDLPMADYLLFFESPVSPTVRQQAEARPLARGSKPLIVDDLVCAGVERKVLSYVREGKNLMAEIIRDPGLLRGR